MSASDQPGPGSGQLPARALAAHLVAEARRIAVLTGAGISTAAGIPDFRGPQGVWTRNPGAERTSTLASYLADDRVRAQAWWGRAHSPALQARPTEAHLALLGLERGGRLAGIITQNTDGLHLAAGHRGWLVHEVHGSARRWRCQDCAAGGPISELTLRVLAGEADPRCPHCGGITRAATILFGEGLDPQVLGASLRTVQTSDLLLVVGSSLLVQPVAGLVPHAHALGVPIIIVNAEPTPFDELAAAVLTGDIQVELPALLGGQG